MVWGGYTPVLSPPTTLPERVMPGQALHIRNMVCDRCIAAVKAELNDMGISVERLVLGEAHLKKPLTEAQLRVFGDRLTRLGFELIDDKRSLLIERVKASLREYVRSEALADRKENLSTLLQRTIGMDYSAISKTFSHVEGATIERYFNLLRLERAKELLVYDTLSLTQIADRLGYSSVQHLSNQFKQFEGHTPTHFKRIGAERRRALDKVRAATSTPHPTQ